MLMYYAMQLHVNAPACKINIKFHCQCIVGITHGLFSVFSDNRKKDILAILAVKKKSNQDNILQWIQQKV